MKIMSSLKSSKNNINCCANGQTQIQTFLNKNEQMLNNDFEKKSNKSHKAILTSGILSIMALLALLAKKGNVAGKLKNTILNFINRKNIKQPKTLQQPPMMYKVIPKGLKKLLLKVSGISSYLKECANKGINPDPQVILKKLKGIGVKVEEEVFNIINDKSKIQNGRKFHFRLGKIFDMVFEVHDYKDDKGLISWVMRLYDNDPKKDLRSYLSLAGSFKHALGSYVDQFTHIACGENGKKFVLGHL